MKDLEIFLDSLALTKNLVNAINLYHGNSIDSQIRRNNLKLYLTKMKDLNPSIMILGEAPGYKGCGLTGIPFTSERIVMENSFFKNEPYKFVNHQKNGIVKFQQR